jgi:hypothetical protein
MATQERTKTATMRSTWADPMPLRASLRTITTLEHLLGVLQDVLGQEDTRIVAVTCQVLSAYNATVLNTIVWRDTASSMNFSM